MILRIYLAGSVPSDPEYEAAVKLFFPSEKSREPNPEARAGGAALIRGGLGAVTARRTCLYVNNRLEGNALETITVMIGPANGA
jgi:hypothetical protein